MYTYIAILAILQAPLLLSEVVPVKDECSASGRILTNLESDAAATVRFSMAGDQKTCYSITAVVDGKSVNGYVEGNDLAAIAEFERQRALAAARPSVSVAPLAPETASVPASVAETPHYPPFRDFSGRDMKGQPVSAHSLKGKVNLVCFWSPSNAASSRELLVVNRLYGQFKTKGVDVVALSLSGDRGQLQDTLEDYHLAFRNVPNGYDIAAQYNISYSTLPVTYVLNENFEVVASGLHAKALEDLVKKLIAAK